jgi:hypothetical protein
VVGERMSLSVHWLAHCFLTALFCLTVMGTVSTVLCVLRCLTAMNDSCLYSS